MTNFISNVIFRYMKYSLITLCVGLVSFLSACDSSDLEEPHKPTPEEQKRYEDITAVESTLKGLEVGFYVEGVGNQGTAVSDEIFYLEKWQGRARIDTILVNSYATHVNFTFTFKNESQCSFSDIKFFLDGQQVEPSELDKGYGPKCLSLEVPETINSEEHDIFVQMDSAKCENLSQSYHFIPATPRPFVYTGKALFNSSISLTGRKEVCRDKFFMDIYASIYELGTTAVFADTVYSNCYLRRGGDSLALDLGFENTGITSLSNHSRAHAYIAEESMAKFDFINDDSTAIIGCALFYQQSSKEYAKPDVVQYTEDSVVFVNCVNHKISGLTVDDSLRISAEIHMATRVFGKVKIKDAYTFFDFEPANIRSVDDSPCSEYDTLPCISHSELAYALEDVCGKDCKQTFDSLQVVIRYIQPYSSLKEAQLTIPSKLEFPKDSAFMDSVINLLVDSDGNALRDCRSLAAKRIANPNK